MEAKASLRSLIQSRFRNLTPPLRDHLSEQIRRRVLDWPVYQQARTLLLYSSIGDEVQTQRLIESALEDGKRVILPRVTDRDLALHVVTGDGECYRKGVFGIREPDPARCPAAALADADLALVPGRAFNYAGIRLGRGAGYYDRLLRERPAALPVFGLAFGFQVVDHVPSAPHDVPVDGVITETELLYPSSVVLHINGEEEMVTRGRQLARAVPPPATFALSGELGAGKTTLTRGLLDGWGAKEGAVSPTYVLVNEYDAQSPVRHLDAYRLDAADLLPEDEEMLTEALDGPGYTLIEWAERVGRLIPPTRIAIHITRTGDTTREMRVETVRSRDRAAASLPGLIAAAH